MFISRSRGLALIAAVATTIPLLGTASAAAAAPVLSRTSAALAAKTPRLSTPWTSQVSPTNALPEYPRPQMTRGQWRNLNGVWQFAPGTAGQNPPIGQALPERDAAY